MLDVGCGDGALTLACWQSGASSVVGCDIDPRMIAHAAARAAQHKAAIGYALGRAETLPFRDRSFDLVTVITVLAFVAEPVSAVREIARVLKPGGRLVIGNLGKWSLWAASRRLRGWFGAKMWNTADSDRLVNCGRWCRRRISASSIFPAQSTIPAVAFSRG